MAYHLGRILQLDFSFRSIAVTVGNETADHGIFSYDLLFPAVTLAEMEANITDDDILIANPSFSSYFFGLKCRGRKVMYAQGFTTFGLLDCGFDLYVSVSEVVRRSLSSVWGIETPVVPPFILAQDFPRSPPWRQRPSGSVLVSLKGDYSHQSFMLDRLRRSIASRYPEVTLDQVLNGKVAHDELLDRIGQHRYFLTLSVGEGFGLMALEAMALGCLVVGFDGFGGRDYMSPGQNCVTVSYPNLEGLAQQLILSLDNLDYAQSVAHAGQATGKSYLYNYARFRAAWREQFARIL